LIQAREWASQSHRHHSLPHRADISGLARRLPHIAVFVGASVSLLLKQSRSIDDQMLASVAKLKQIKAKLQGSAEAAVATPYEVQCVCGDTVTGVRRATWIQRECQSCLQSVFVLPANTYPSTPSVPSEILDGSFTDRLKSVVAELLPRREQETVDSASSAKPVSTVATADADPPRAVATAEEKVHRRLSLPTFDIKVAVFRIVTPFRILMLAMIAVVTLTAYWMTYQRAVEAAHHTWLKSTDDALALLEDRDFLQLEVVLTKAVNAGKVLGKDDPEWRGTLNLLQETQAINSIAAGSLLMAFHRAYDTNASLVAGAAALLREEASTGTFVFDSYLHHHPETAGVLLMDLPATPGLHSVEVTITVPGIQDLLHANGDERVLFAAQIRSVQAPASDTRDAWKLQIDPHSFVLLTNPVHCEEIGLSPDDYPHIANILTRQRDFVASSQQWEHRADEPGIRTQFSETANIKTPLLNNPNE
jgi:hypothetical protein